MNSPQRPDGPPLRDGKPYSAIAHLAESVTPFVAMAQACASAASRRRRSIAADRDAGLLVIEDLGEERWWPAIRRRRSRRATRRRSTRWWRCTAMRLPDVLPVEPDLEYRLPRYDMEALLIEAELLLDWYLPRLGAKVSDVEARGLLRAVARGAAPAIEAPPTWVLRDFHSPNLLWLPQRKGSPASASWISRTR